MLNSSHILFCKVGVTSEGKLNGIDLSFYCDCGSSPNEVDVSVAQVYADNGTYAHRFL